MHQHSHCFGRTTPTAGSFQLRNGAGEPIGSRFFDGGAIDAGVDQTAFRLGSPLVAPMFKQSFQADPPHKVRSRRHGPERHFEKSQTMKETAALAVRSFAVEIKRGLSANGIRY